ncbi:MAG: A/G-specific adenine glycosylase [Candidatus Binatia bacterium]
MTRALAPASAVRRALLGWFARHSRDLPWRSRRDPWRVWVSEVMLQQTRVEAVVEPYSRFVAAFPSLASLARATESEVLARWSGLGYYRRARLLHAGARFVVENHRGRIPRTRVELEKVPGIGAYTAGALLSIAFGRREIALDANVTRVIARLLAVADPASSKGRGALAAFAGELVDCTRPGDVNEALMDLGSAVCTARDARCHLCPLARLCRGFATGRASGIAAPRARKPPRRIDLACAVVRDGERVLFLRRPTADALLGGLWDLPTVEIDSNSGAPGDAAAPLRELLRLRSGLDARLEGPLARVRHEIVGRKIVASVYEASAGKLGRLPHDARMLAAGDLEGVGLPALPVKILRALDRREPAKSSGVRAEG